MRLPPNGTELPMTLEDCHAMIRRLLDENAALRRSAASFGSLAERLNIRIKEEGHRERHHETEGPAGTSWIANDKSKG